MIVPGERPQVPGRLVLEHHRDFAGRGAVDKVAGGDGEILAAKWAEHAAADEAVRSVRAHEPSAAHSIAARRNRPAAIRPLHAGRARGDVCRAGADCCLEDRAVEVATRDYS